MGETPRRSGRSTVSNDARAVRPTACPRRTGGGGVAVSDGERAIDAPSGFDDMIVGVVIGGQEQALESFNEGAADIAGFHGLFVHWSSALRPGGGSPK